MHIFETPTDILKDLIFDHLLIEATKCQYSSDFFSFKWNDDKSMIIHEDVDYVVDGNSCWEDSEQTTKYTSARSFDDNTIGEFFNYFLIDYNLVNKQNENNMTATYFEYLDNYKFDYEYHNFVSEDTRQEAEDCYYNYDRVRTLSINIDEILAHLKKLNVPKDLSEVKSIFHNLHGENLETIIHFNHLDSKFPEKNIRTKKNKI